MGRQTGISFPVNVIVASSVNGEGTIDEWNNSLCSMILSSAYECIPLKKNPKAGVGVPWWLGLVIKHLGKGTVHIDY